MKLPALLTAITLSLTVAACSTQAESSQAPNQQSPATQSSSTESAQPVRNLSPRGMVIKQVGEPGYYGGPQNLTPENAEIKFTVDNIGVDSMCGDSYGAVVNGRPVQLDISVETRDLSQDIQAMSTGMFSPHSWKWLRADGTTEGVSQQPTDGNIAFYCSERASFLDPLASNSKYNGSIWLDVPQDATALMLTSYNGGWEWELPAS